MFGVFSSFWLKEIAELHSLKQFHTLNMSILMNTVIPMRIQCLCIYIYIILYNDNVSLVAFRAGAHGTSCPPVESEASILIQHPHPAVEQPFGAQKAVVCIDGSRED